MLSENKRLYRFSEFTSGGYFRLHPCHYKRLEDSGWTVGDREAYARFSSNQEAGESWENATGLEWWEQEACECCGPAYEMHVCTDEDTKNWREAFLS